MKLKDKATIKTNFPEADFWIVRRGSEHDVGKPTKKFSEYHIGIKVTSDDLLPDYLYYAMTYLHNQGYFKRLATGMSNLVNIQVKDVKDIHIG